MDAALHIFYEIVKTEFAMGQILVKAMCEMLHAQIGPAFVLTLFYTLAYVL